MEEQKPNKRSYCICQKISSVVHTGEKTSDFEGNYWVGGVTEVLVEINAGDSTVEHDSTFVGRFCTLYIIDKVHLTFFYQLFNSLLHWLQIYLCSHASSFCGSVQLSYSKYGVRALWIMFERSDWAYRIVFARFDCKLLQNRKTVDCSIVKQ